MIQNRYSLIFTHLQQVANVLLWLIVIIYGLLVVHDFFGYIDNYPYLAGDDALANVAYSLATEGRYGDLILPIQPHINVPRHNGFFNYGPWYFYLAAGLIWLFGYSLTLLRSIHLLVILTIIVSSALWFKKGAGAIAGAFFALALWHSFDIAHWPMVRPDSFVALFAILFVILAGLALKSQKNTYWFGAGLAAACAAFTHLAAWSLVPACILVFLTAQLYHRLQSDNQNGWYRQAVWSLLAVTLGGVSGVFMFYASFGFQIQNHLSMLGLYNTVIAGPRTEVALGSTNYSFILVEHLKWAFNYLPQMSRLGLVIMWLVGWSLLFLSIRSGSKYQKQVLIYLFPPLLVWSLYVLTLGAYPNFHVGYTILNQVMAFWSIAAILYTLLNLVNHQFNRAGLLISFVLILLVLVMGGYLIRQKLTTTTYKTKFAQQWVSISAYIDEILNPLPVGAHSWGTIMYGIETPERIQLIRYIDAIRAATTFSSAERANRAPDYIIWGYLENSGNILLNKQDSKFKIQILSELFPDYRYKVVSMVAAPPYGVTRIYQRQSKDTLLENNRPLISLYQPETKQWNHQIGPRLEAALIDGPEVKIQVTLLGVAAQAASTDSLVTTLDKGDYLFRVKFRTGMEFSKGNMLAITTVPVIEKPISELGFDFDLAPYFNYDQEAFLIHRHSEGKVYISQFDLNPQAEIFDVEIYPIVGLKNFYLDRLQDIFKPLPPLTEWTAGIPDQITISILENNQELLVTGNNSQYDYQILSPPIPVQAHSQVTLRLPIALKQGSIGVGILDQSGQNWLLSPTELKSEYKFESGSNETIQIVVSNNNVLNTDEPSQFIIQPGFYSDWQEKLYTDILIDKSVYPEEIKIKP